VKATDITFEEQKIKKSIKDLAKTNQVASAKQLAKELIRSRKAKERLYESKAQINSVVMQLSQSLGSRVFFVLPIQRR
jgi:charged multivesicular body protein 3